MERKTVCKQCQAAISQLRRWAQHIVARISSSSLVLSSAQVELHPSLESLKNCVADGCKLCSLILSDISEHKMITKGRMQAVFVRFEGYVPSEKREPLAVYCGSPLERISLIVLWSFSTSVPKEVLNLLGDSVTQSNSTTGSTESLNYARFWLKKCIDSHPQCQVTQRFHRQLPRRVIDVGVPHEWRSSEPFLFENTSNSTDVGDFDLSRWRNPGLSENVDYIALSHCWGEAGKYMLTTTKDTLRMRCEKIPLKSMPLTFQHAVHITRELGYRYLWIDSLCIIQDSPEDWASESAKMASIYQNAKITLCASYAANSSVGCFFNRAGSSLRYCLLHFPGDEEDGEENVEERSCFVLPHNAGRPGGLRSLDQRAWALQEELLSPRKLMFDYDEIRWRCQEWNVSQSHTVPELPMDFNSPMPQIPVKDLRTFSIILSQFTAGRRMLSISQSRLASCWHGIVADYSHRVLTLRTDRFAAIAGIARVIELGASCTYMAGLWKEFWWRDILWCEGGLQNRDYVSHRGNASLERSEVAPSWSWAYWARFSHLRFLTDHIADSLAPSAILLSFKANGSEFNRAGSLLTLRGELTKGMIGERMSDNLSFRILDREFLLSAYIGPCYGANAIDINLDFDLDVGSPFWMLKIATERSDSNYNEISYGLILTRRISLLEEHIEQRIDFLYRRIGVIRYISRDGFRSSSGPVNTITIE